MTGLPEPDHFEAAAMQGALERFEIEVPDEVLEDLGHRLLGTQFADPAPDEPWQAGADPGYLREQEPQLVADSLRTFFRDLRER